MGWSEAGLFERCLVIGGGAVRRDRGGPGASSSDSSPTSASADSVMLIARRRSTSPHTVKAIRPPGRSTRLSLDQRGGLVRPCGAHKSRASPCRTTLSSKKRLLALPIPPPRLPGNRCRTWIDHLLGEVEGDDCRSPSQCGADQGPWPSADVEHVEDLEPYAGGVQRRLGGGAGHSFETLRVGRCRPAPRRPVVVVDAG